MTQAEHLPLADVKNRLSEVVERLEREHGRVVITKHGRPAVVMLSQDDLSSLEETLALFSDPAAMAAIREGSRDLEAGDSMVWTKDEALAAIRARG